jgi:hypothetical protein
VKTGDCTCDKCINTCKGHPGWFAPGEAENAAKHLMIPFTKFKRLLIKDTASNPFVSDAPYVYSPRKRKVDRRKDKNRHEYSQGKKGTCVFLYNKRCGIHAVKPYECRKVYGCYPAPQHRDDIEEMYRKDGFPLGRRKDIIMNDDINKFEIAHTNNPEEMIISTQRSLIKSMRGVIHGLKSSFENKTPGMTWEQIDYFLDKFEEKKAKNNLSGERILIPLDVNRIAEIKKRK